MYIAPFKNKNKVGTSLLNMFQMMNVSIEKLI